ncbi:MAG: class I SAM-dependent methyltransferase [Coprobacillaceae bacterium]
MKENKYDSEIFFEKYSNMSRSKLGVEGAGEWSELKKILPNFKNKRVLDLGCGYGWHCIYAANNGADFVLGIDLSEKMLKIAKEKNNHPNITYQKTAIEDLVCPKDSFDIIISSLALHYIQDYDYVIKKVRQWLTKGGYFVFSVEHPTFTAYGSQDWYYDDNGNILHFPVDNYYYEGKRNAIFLGEQVTKYHRTLTTYLATLLNNDFELIHVIEPQPPIETLDNPDMKNEMRRPMMLLVSARKK